MNLEPICPIIWNMSINSVTASIHDIGSIMDILVHLLGELDECDNPIDEIMDLILLFKEDEDEDNDIWDAWEHCVECIVTDNQKAVEPSPLDLIAPRIQAMRDCFQPAQRTPEWYAFRWNMLSASNAYKALGTQASINQLIYEKCKPLLNPNEVSEPVSVNTESPLHWGQKYEPVTVQLYEHKHGTTIEMFGCLQHPLHSFIGASPDGLISDPSSPLYGRLIEIKNVVSREINGVPKPEYFVQMQLQMEVCDLDVCDFVETKFTEFESMDAFLAEDDTKEKGEKGKEKGAMIQFVHQIDGTVVYEYHPIDGELTLDSLKVWGETSVNEYEMRGYMFVKRIFWKLDVYSCVTVKRDREWFRAHLPKLEKVWNIIKAERETGYEHRAPKKREASNNPVAPRKKTFVDSFTGAGCLLVKKLN
jgi:putative phage-type endonuclease